MVVLASAASDKLGASTFHNVYFPIFANYNNPAAELDFDEAHRLFAFSACVCGLRVCTSACLRVCVCVSACLRACERECGRTRHAKRSSMRLVYPYACVWEREGDSLSRSRSLSLSISLFLPKAALAGTGRAWAPDGAAADDAYDGIVVAQWGRACLRAPNGSATPCLSVDQDAVPDASPFNLIMRQCVRSRAQFGAVTPRARIPP